MGIMSMTGYGHGKAVLKGVHAEAELSSVNRKQLDIRIGMDKSLLALEGRVVALVSGAVSRGSVSGSVVVRSLSPKTCRVRIDDGMAASFVAELRRVAKKTGLHDDLGARALLYLPDLVSPKSVELDAEAIWPAVKSALEAALKGLTSMRAKEGASLAGELLKHVKLLQSMLEDVSKLAVTCVDKSRQKLVEKLSQAGMAEGRIPQDLAREIAVQAEKCDVAEEIARLRSHMAQAGTMLKASGSCGRNLDFLVQEILREINTIGSKADDIQITDRAVAMKAELERFREQIQNVE